MLRIEKLIVDNIGPFKHQEFVFKEKALPDKAEIQLFAGQNGTGKTTILEMLTCIAELNFNPARRARFMNERSEFTISINNGKNAVFKVNAEDYYSQDSVLDNYQNRVDWHDRMESRIDYAFFAYSGYRKVNTHAITAIKEIQKSPFEHATDFNNSVDPGILIDWIANQKTKEALASRQNDHLSEAKYTRTISKIERAVENIIGEKIEFRLHYDPLKVVINKGGIDIDFDLLPDGLKSIVSWISDLLMRLDRIRWADNTDVLDRNFILFLDEIDVHLHPAWQRKILPVVQDLFKNAQIFVTTHSPFVIGSVDGVWVHKLVSDGKDTTAAEAKLSDSSKSYELILDELFDVREFFGVGVEEQLAAFGSLRNRLLQQRSITDDDKAELHGLIDFFKGRNSVELDNIIGSELRQLSRLLKENLSYS